MKKLIATVLSVFLFSPSVWAGEMKTYTDKEHLYSVDCPADWRIKKISKVCTFFSPLESKEDKFAENVNIVVEDLEDVPGVTLIDYHRKGMASARNLLQNFEVLEEAQTQFMGHEAIAVIYTMKDRGVTFKIKAYTFFVSKKIYVLNYNATLLDHDRYLKTAETIMRSIRVSP